MLYYCVASDASSTRTVLSVVLNYIYPFKLQPVDPPILALGCLIVDFITTTPMVTHECASSPLISMISILFLHISDHIVFGMR